MSKPFFIVNIVLITLVLHNTIFASAILDKQEKAPIIITSQTLTADNKNGTVVFEGSVVAKTSDIKMYSDKMTVFYDSSEKKVKKIHAIGNVKVNKEETALFSEEAIYLEEEEKIIFTGNPKAVEGENVISGKQITFFLKDGRAEVEESRVLIQNTQDLE